jgi:hypothetical protein
VSVNDDEDGGGGSRGAAGSEVDAEYCSLEILVVVEDVGREVAADDVVAVCCCFAVSSTGMGRVKASSTLGSGPRGL